MTNNKKNTDVVKRETVDNSIIKEMEDKYPRFSVKGVAYELGLTYFTFETNYFTSLPVRKLIKKYGAEIVSSICYFREQMCQPNGWHVRVDGEYFDDLIEKGSFQMKIDEENLKTYYREFIDNQVFFEITDDKGTYLTDVQQIFNFEILNNSRARDRIRKANARAKKDNKYTSNDSETIDTKTENTIGTNSQITESKIPTAPLTPPSNDDLEKGTDIENFF